ncbi:MAG: 50S ribosomal protein L17 [Clostridia bacterium]|nr:50S ribosomal protein L17 [Clostridia bacterium]
MQERKLGRPTDQRLALLKNQVSYFLWYGKLETTYARAKEIQKIAEKYIATAIKVYEDTVTVDKKKMINGAMTDVEVINDGAKKLAVRRMLTSNLNDIQEVRMKKESPAAFRKRQAGIKHPLIEKIFNVYAPLYKEVKGGYTSVYKLGMRKGDGAEMAIIKLNDADVPAQAQ